MIYVVAGTSTLGLAVSFFFCELVQNGKKSSQESTIALTAFGTAFGKGCLLLRSWLRKPKYLKMMQSFG